MSVDVLPQYTIGNRRLITQMLAAILTDASILRCFYFIVIQIYKKGIVWLTLDYLELRNKQ